MSVAFGSSIAVLFADDPADRSGQHGDREQDRDQVHRVAVPGEHLALEAVVSVGRGFIGSRVAVGDADRLR